MNERLAEWAAGKGYRAAAGPATIAEAAREGIGRMANGGEIDPELLTTYLRWLGRERDPMEAAARTLIVVAYPSSALLVTFTLPERRLRAVIPPTYAEDAGADERIRTELLELLPELDDLRQARPAQKAMSAALGLTTYGLNNITYAPGLGSFIRISAYVSDRRIEGADPLQALPVRTLPECDSCGRCREACPTGAIPRDRFPLHARRCLTFLNELPGSWPAWLPSRAHNCLIGCMICQEICPCNEGMLRTIDSGVVFNREETAVILHGEPEQRSLAWSSVTPKLLSLGIADLSEVLGRNLAALVAAS